jgi:hypothetical protein
MIPESVGPGLIAFTAEKVARTTVRRALARAE